ncbi:hypothetical protein GIX45_14585 [Erwinia sp. CPCC 100877]|nr:hypothetical protein [Erwinia sp. CPCC 100877]
MEKVVQTENATIVINETEDGCVNIKVCCCNSTKPAPVPTPTPTGSATPEP